MAPDHEPVVETRSHGRGGWATAVLTERVLPSRVVDFEEWTLRANANLARAEGFLGIDTIRVDDESTPRYVTMIHFRSQDLLDRWQTSAAHQALLAELEPMIADKTVDRAEGLEIWYSLPPASRRANPSYWRQVVVTTPVVLGLILLVNAALGPLTGNLPEVAQLAISVTAVSMLLAWPVMPWVTRSLRGFLYPDD